MSASQDGGRTVLVTGGSRGIGRAVTLALAGRAETTIVVNYLQNDGEAERTAELVWRRGSTPVLAKANVGDPDQVDDLLDLVLRTAAGLDAIVHCAALGAFKPVMEVKPNQWDLTMGVNARGFLHVVQRSVPLMRGGAIVAVSSLGGRSVLRNYGAMGPTKAALESLVRYLAVELAPQGIRVNAVSAGFVETDAMKVFPHFETIRQEISAHSPAGRIANADDIVGPILFLLDPASHWINGQILVADGGASL